jgi:hypothetical protein
MKKVNIAAVSHAGQLLPVKLQIDCLLSNDSEFVISVPFCELH